MLVSSLSLSRRAFAQGVGPPAPSVSRRREWVHWQRTLLRGPGEYPRKLTYDSLCILIV